MKKILFLATVLVAGAATVGIAQISTEERNEAAKASFVKANGFNFQDTTKPKKDTIPSKDSASIRF